MLRPLFYLCVLVTLQGAARAEICTLTGPTVIDFQDHLNNVTDRCAYSLLADSGNDLKVVANFRERRRRDVSFVDSVTLTVGSSANEIVLEQGGRVLVNNVGMPINSTGQNFFGVDVVKDETGVTAEFTTTEYTINVFFDGTTAQISMEVPVNSTLAGLCIDASNVSSEKRTENSPLSCEEQFQDPADNSIDCAALTARCNELRDPLLSDCNADIDPTPYINACSETLCKYSAADGLRCQFMRAYARACSLNGHNVPNAWRIKTRCPNRAFCQDKFCTDHEFCGRKFSGDNGCLCRAVFAHPYKEADTLGDPTVCEANSASLTLFNCLLEERGIDYTVLHLNNQSCRGELDEAANTVTFSFNTENLCGAEITFDENRINYTNTIMNQNFTDVIIRHDQVFIEFSCFNPQPQLKTVAFTINDNSYMITLQAGEWTYNVSMIPYIDEKCTKVVATDTEVKLNQKVWVELKTEGLDADTIAVVTDSCWATSVPDPDSTPRHDLIKNGCANPDDGTVRVMGNGVGTSNRFSFNMFEFT
ncbi:uncharacterized protein LOC108251611, partial [Kryptolebias marmoratus]|uniref:uncharacterized protein LOC108251611 n=1 Tax=Kryptolebias marmoratus TaxID=37003 RepID=UPI0018ACE2ED